MRWSIWVSLMDCAAEVELAFATDAGHDHCPGLAGQLSGQLKTSQEQVNFTELPFLKE